MTTAEAARAAQDAMALATSISEDVEALSEKFTELDQRTRDGGSPAADPSAGLVDSTGAPVLTRDQVDSRIHEALQPLHDEVHELRAKGTLTPESQTSLHAVLARLEAAEQKLAPLDGDNLTVRVAQDLHPTLSELRRRLDTLEKEQHGHNPAADTLAEDALNDMVEARVVSEVDRRLAHISLPSASDAVREALRPTFTPNGMGAARKVLQLMKLVTHIGKERQADMGQGGKFRFRGIDEAMDAVGHAMREVGVILSPEVLKDETSTTPVTKKGDGRNGPYESTILWTTTKLTMRYTFVDPEDGSTHPIEMVGEGRDASDKSTSKAGSMAFKYALLQALCIPVNGLDDSDNAPPQVMENERSTAPATQPPAQQQAPPQRTEEQKAQRAGEALQALRNVHLVQGAQARYDRVVAIMNRVKAEGLLEFAVEGSTLNQHGQATLSTLAQAAQSEEQPGGYQSGYDGRASTEPPEPPADYQGSY
jgi:ERF superfamily